MPRWNILAPLHPNTSWTSPFHSGGDGLLGGQAEPHEEGRRWERGGFHCIARRRRAGHGRHPWSAGARQGCYAGKEALWEFMSRSDWWQHQPTCQGFLSSIPSGSFSINPVPPCCGVIAIPCVSSSLVVALPIYNPCPAWYWPVLFHPILSCPIYYSFPPFPTGYPPVTQPGT